MGRRWVWQVLEMTSLVLLETSPSFWASYHHVPATAQLHPLHGAGQLVTQAYVKACPVFGTRLPLDPRRGSLDCFPTLRNKGNSCWLLRPDNRKQSCLGEPLGLREQHPGWHWILEALSRSQVVGSNSPGGRN